MKISHLIFSLVFALTVNCAYAATDVDDTVKTFAEIYQKLDSVQWGGKNIGIVIESLEHLSPNAHLAATDDRIILVWRDSIVGNFQKPAAGDWENYGKITKSLIDKMRDRDDSLAALSNEEIYERAVAALMQGIDESGKYIQKQTLSQKPNRILTSLGIDGWREQTGDFRVSSVIKGSPADMAGIQISDLIDKINGRDVAAMADGELESVLHGLNSGTAKLHLLTPSGNRNVVLRRATIVLADADIIYRPMQDTALLEIIVHEMTDNAANIVNEALLKYNNVSGIILDLRAAGGVDARAATKMAGLFMGAKPVMRVSQTAGEDMEFVPGGNAITDANLVVLMSNMTRGTAEAVASAIYENGRGVLVGTPTAGSARIATRIDLSNGAALELLNKSIKSGSGISLDSRGVFPIVCLSNIRSSKQQNAFFVNVINNDFNIQDFNKDAKVNVDAVRRGCPVITSGDDEDMMSAAIATRILTDKTVYNRLIAE
ncbi:MAG: PDZ domain-containing protein [Alphaproteobacteria bacterium]|nr:PDZ domain-containing protein [Alphaproteobacteria bacterium]